MDCADLLVPVSSVFLGVVGGRGFRLRMIYHWFDVPRGSLEFALLSHNLLSFVDMEILLHVSAPFSTLMGPI